ncbi:TetR/AcrR family transcriptional regulator [Nonomuraea mangrovi]|uniref:TetR/AcrR family transcriptional regulator n=1 Tax=Nonomuraea mangrovi TaxID=2316207 RepID=A0ABW4SQ35_9ACTN
MGLRERKKQRTREALIAAALELFESEGYERTTVARIAADADVSTRTFFLHFPTKEDLLLADTEERVAAGLRIVEDRPPGEHAADLLLRAVDEMIAHVGDTGLASGLAYTRVRLILSVPEVRARMLQRLADAQTAIADALGKAYPGTLDPVAAAAVVGAVVGAVTAAAIVTVQRADPPEQVVAAMRRAAEIALSDIRRAYPEARPA